MAYAVPAFPNLAENNTSQEVQEFIFEEEEDGQTAFTVTVAEMFDYGQISRVDEKATEQDKASGGGGGDPRSSVTIR